MLSFKQQTQPRVVKQSERHLDQSSDMEKAELLAACKKNENFFIQLLNTLLSSFDFEQG